VHKLDSKVLKTLSIPLPIREEQKRIVAILDEAFAGIATALANTRKNLANARELFESYLNSVFTETPDNWRERKLGDVCTIKHGFAFKSKYFAPIGDYVVLTPGSFFEYGGFRDQGGKTKFYTGDVPEGFILEKDDFLIAMTEQAVGLLGSSLIVPEADLYLHNQRLGRVRVREGFDWHNDFFLHQFNTTRFRDAVQATASGVKVRHTSPTKLEAISVQVPPNKIDQEIVADRLNNLLAESRRLERIARQKLTALADLKQSLLRKAFSGELTAGKVAPNAILMEEDVA
jgi:type I restriction enzyme S subunit